MQRRETLQSSWAVAYIHVAPMSTPFCTFLSAAEVWSAVCMDAAISIAVDLHQMIREHRRQKRARARLEHDLACKDSPSSPASSRDAAATAAGLPSARNAVDRLLLLASALGDSYRLLLLAGGGDADGEEGDADGCSETSGMLS